MRVRILSNLLETFSQQSSIGPSVHVSRLSYLSMRSREIDQFKRPAYEMMYVRRALSNASNTIRRASVGRKCETLDEITKEGNVMYAQTRDDRGSAAWKRLAGLPRGGTWRIYAPLMTIRFRDRPKLVRNERGRNNIVTGRFDGYFDANSVARRAIAS